MRKRELQLPPDHIYGVDEWSIIQKQYYPKFVAQDETLFAVANGYFGMRGNFDEGEPMFQRGTFVNGFYETWPIVYGEEAYGFAKTGQTMINVTDSHIIKLYVDDEAFLLPSANILEFERRLDMRSGTLNRDVVWEMPSGKKIAVKTKRFASFHHKHIGVMSYEVTALSDSVNIVLSSQMKYTEDSAEVKDDDPRKAPKMKHKAMLPQAAYAANQRAVLCHQTANSKMTLATGIDHVIQSDQSAQIRCSATENKAKITYSLDLPKGASVTLRKFVSYHKSGKASSEEMCGRVERSLDRTMAEGYDMQLAEQEKYVQDFWRRSDIQIETARPIAQQCIRFNLFHILQATGRAEKAGIGARGLTGSAYEGHYFWDTETYILPFLIYTAPRIARNVLMHRYNQLEKAKRRAKEVNQQGALFPWRTISGDEASAFFAAGTAQYHINADIIYALRRYVEVSGDDDFLYRYGAEMLIETARLWADLGFYQEDNGKEFHIHGVTGPDEYTAIVNNNTFTNLMARENLRYAVKTLRAMETKRPDKYAALAHESNLRPEEIEDWHSAAEHMYVPYDKEQGIHPQDDNFLKRERWDFANTPDDKYPLLLHYHPLVLYRHQVIKQADVVLAMFMVGHEFSHDQKKRNFDYYDPLTTGDSSLSACVQSIIAAELGYAEKTMEYITQAALMDFADVGGNVRDGAHIASMGGTWMTFVYGLAGLRDVDGVVTFRPRLYIASENFKRLRFPLTVRGQLMEVLILPTEATYTILEGEGLTIQHEGQDIELKPGHPVTCPISCK